MKPNITRLYWFIILSMIFFVLIFHLNRLTLFTSDDYAYHYVYQGYLPTTNLKRVEGLKDIIISQINHWRLWNGRFVAHTIVQFFLQFKKIYFDIFNTIAYIGLMWLILSLSKLKENRNIQPLTYIILFIFLWFYLPEIGTSVLWVSGSGNYLWTSLIYLCFFKQFIDSLHQQFSHKKGLLLILLAFLAGACNENTSPTILLICFLFTIRYSSKLQIQSIYQIVSLLMGGCGFLIMMSSPGSLNRGEGALNLGLFFSKTLAIIQQLFSQYWLIYLIIALLITTLFVQKRALSTESLLFLKALLLGHFLSAIVLALSPEMPKRTFFGSVLFLAIILSSLVNLVLTHIIASLPLFVTTTVILVSCFMVSYHNVHIDLTKTFNEVTLQYQILYETEAAIDVAIPFFSPPNTDYNAYFATNNLKSDPNDWFNQWMAAYFHKKSITGY